MNKALKLKLLPIVAILLALILCLTTLTSLSFLGTRAHAQDDVDFSKFNEKALNIDNNQFTNGSGSPLKTPDSWTGGGLNGSGAGSVVSGIMDIPQYAKDKESFKIGEHKDDKFANEVPKTIFGGTDYEGTDAPALFINSRPNGGTGTGYGYSSSAMTFDPGRFYRINVWVKTGDFTDGQGAAIRLNGLGEDVAFNKINTVSGKTELNEGNDYGWEEYQIFVASNAVTSKTVTLSLQVGDYYKSETDENVSLYNPSTGYAWFDNVSANEISPATFYKEKSRPAISSNTIIKDFSDLANYKNPNATIKYEDNNYNFTNGTEGWKTYTVGNSDWADAKYGTYDASGQYSDSADNMYKTDFNLTKDPLSSLAKYVDDSDILLISSYEGGKEYNSVSLGLRSPDINVKRYGYYRISAWVKTFEVTGGTGATMTLHSERGETDKDKFLNTKISSCTGDDANLARAGFKQYSFYVKGSSIKDTTVQLDLGLGSEGGEAKGLAMFDNVTVEEITPKFFTDNSASGTIVNIDTDAGKDGAPGVTFPTTTIANGMFNFAGEYKDYKFPMPVADWTMYDVASVGTTGYSPSADLVKTDSAISGLMPIDNAHFNQNQSSYGKGAENPRTKPGSLLNESISVLYMSSAELTAYCYRSPVFTIAAPTAEDTATKIGMLTVSMNVENIVGYGANLVLKSGTNVIASIEKIGNTNGFKTFTFYIEPGKTDVSDLSVEIWLGLNDRTNNISKQSSGNVYVQKVDYQSVEQAYSVKKAEYDNARRFNTTITAATYSFANEDLSAYDYYDTGFVKYPYNWKGSVVGTEEKNVKYGIFDSKSIPSNQMDVPTTFKNSSDAKNNGVLFLKNSVPAASKLTLNTKYSIEAEKYYEIKVRVKVDIPAQADSTVGAGINLVGTDFKFKNIKSTTEIRDQHSDKEVFQTFTFYIKAGAEASSIGIELTLGQEGKANGYSTGIVYLNEISFTESTNVIYDENTTDEKLKDNNYVVKAELSAAKEDDAPPKEKTPIQWWLIPSILFAVAILIALIGFTVRKALAKRASKVTYEKTVSYDRSATLNKEFNANTTDENEKLTNVTTSDDQNYDSFNDDAPTAQQVKVPAKTTETVTVPEQTDTNEKAESTEQESQTEESVKEEEKPQTNVEPYKDTFED